MSGRTISVKNATELTRAIRTATGGDTILLAPGNYGDVVVNSVNPSSAVTIRSANADVEAVFSGIVVNRASNFIFDDIEVARPLRAGESDAVRAIRVQNSKDISFVGLDIHGSLNGNANDDGSGFSASGSSRIAVLDSSFREFNTAAMFTQSKDVIFAGNTVQTAREGLNVAELDGALFERNHFSAIVGDAARSDHADAIQVHAGGAFKSSTDITIRSNVLQLGTAATQGIFIRNEKGLQGQSHSNIVIEDNYYEGNSRHGISLTFATNVTVSDNTVRDIGSGGLVPAILLQNVRGAVVEGNIAPLFLGSERTANNSNVTWSDNIDVWDRLRGVGVNESTLFDTRAGGAGLDFSKLNVRGGSAAAAEGIGFAAIDNIGDIKASSAAVLAAYLPQFDQHAAHAVML